jgi:biopolymer transport protein ExbB/TolQ
MNLNIFSWSVLDWANNSVYAVQGIVALIGLYHVVVCFFRIAQKRFRTLDAQDEFLDELGKRLEVRNFDAAMELCAGDQRAVCQLAELGMANRDLGYAKVRQLLLDRFQRDVLADLEHRISWINTVVKTEPMLGLLGTVMGMVQAFGQLAAATTAEPTELAGAIGVALYTTAIGLTIAIPLIVCMSAINVRIRKMEDSVGAGLTRFFDMFRHALQQEPPKGAKR